MNKRKEKLAEICQSYKVAILYSFGSRGKEALRWLHEEVPSLVASSSDLDLGFKSVRGESLSLQEQIHLTQALEDLFGICRIDLLDLDKVNPYLAAEVVHGERLYTCDEYMADMYDLYVLRREGDLEYLENQKARLILGVLS
jgi:uncharacterized protein